MQEVELLSPHPCPEHHHLPNRTPKNVLDSNKQTNSCRNTSILFVHSLSGKLDFQNFKEIFPYKKQRVLRFTFIFMFFLKKISSVHRKCPVFQVLFKTNSDFCCTSFLHSVWVRKPKKWQQPVPDHFDGSEEFFSELCFLDNGLESQQGTVQLLWNKIKFEGFTIDFKGNKWFLWSKCLELDKSETSLGLKKFARTRTIKTACELPAGAGKFLPVTRGNRRQTVPAEIFACIRG